MSSFPIDATTTTTLDRLQIGETALVDDVEHTQADNSSSMRDIARRLKELGFVRGETVKVLHKGYFGGEPLAVRIGQSTFALRQFEAALIAVTKPRTA